MLTAFCCVSLEAPLDPIFPCCRALAEGHALALLQHQEFDPSKISGGALANLLIERVGAPGLSFGVQSMLVVAPHQSEYLAAVRRAPRHAPSIASL
jgi:hypothetical protein